RVQHALRAYTPADQRGLKAAAQSFRTNPAFDTAQAIQDLGVGEALVSLLDARGAPAMVERTLIRPPASRLGPLTEAERAAVLAASPVRGLYDTAKDGALRPAEAADLAARALAQARVQTRAPADPARPSPARPRSNRQGMGEAFAKSVLRTVGSQIGREIVRGVLGGMRRR
ncbi:MAG TPA: DUF853 family protein, partial [Phenylobacterium sp.]|nr:DUF853 family protein [Phenylobacterium sp.]